MRRGLVWILVLANLLVLAYSARLFLGTFHYPLRLYLQVFRYAIPIALFIVAAVSRSVFLLNSVVPFLVAYGPVYFLRSDNFTFLLATQLSLLVILFDLVYSLAADRKVREFRSFFWGLLLGAVLLLGCHHLLFGIAPDLKLPILKTYDQVVGEIDKAF